MRRALTSEPDSVSDSGSSDATLLHWIAKHPPLSPELRLGVYRTAWWLRLFESLQEDYGAVERYVGKAEFKRLTREYLSDYAPRSYTLVHASDRFPEFIAEQNPGIETADLEFDTEAPTPAADPRLAAADLARLERAQYQAYYAANPKIWDTDALRSRSPTQAAKLRLWTQPSVTLIRSRWQILRYLEDQDASCSPGISRILVFREGLETCTRELKDDLQFKLLDRMRGGATLGELAELAGASPWTEWLFEWARAGVIGPK